MTSSPRGGRPPDLENRKAVLQATRDTLAEVGYSALTIDGVAKRAGLYRLLIYRTWETKVALVVDALFGTVPEIITPDQGSLAADLRSFIAQNVAIISRPEYLRGMPGLLVEIRTDESLGQLLNERYANGVVADLGALLDRAEQRGEIADPPDPAIVYSAIVGAIQSIAAAGHLSGDALTDFLVEMTVSGMLEPPAA